MSTAMPSGKFFLMPCRRSPSVINWSPLQMRPPTTWVSVLRLSAVSSRCLSPVKVVGSPCTCPQALPSPHHTSWWTICVDATTSMTSSDLSIPPATPVLMMLSGWKLWMSSTAPAAALTFPMPHWVSIISLRPMLPVV